MSCMKLVLALTLSLALVFCQTGIFAVGGGYALAQDVDDEPAPELVLEAEPVVEVTPEGVLPEMPEEPAPELPESEPAFALASEAAYEEEEERALPVQVQQVQLSSASYEVGQALHVAPVITGGRGPLLVTYWVYNQFGVIADQVLNTNSTSMDFYLGVPGIYLVRVFATDGQTGDWCDSDWVTVSSPSRLQVAQVSFTVSPYAGGNYAYVSAQVVGGNAPYYYSYWVFNEFGEVVDQKVNTTEANVSFSLTRSGTYLVRVYATDFVTDDTGDSDWVSVISPVQVQPVQVNAVQVTSQKSQQGETLHVTPFVTGGHGPYFYNYWLFNESGALVSTRNTDETSIDFYVEVPGRYFVRVQATDNETSDWCDSAVFEVSSMLPVQVSQVSLSSNFRVGGRLTVNPLVTGGTGLNYFSYYMYNDQGMVVWQKTNTLDSSANLTMTRAGLYLVRVFVSDSSGATVWTDSEWFRVW